MKKEQDKKEKLKKIVIARLSVLPSGVSLSIGSEGNFSKEELIKHIEKDDQIGEKIMEIELAYLKLLKEGNFYEQFNSNH